MVHWKNISFIHYWKANVISIFCGNWIEKINKNRIQFLETMFQHNCINTIEWMGMTQFNLYVVSKQIDWRPACQGSTNSLPLSLFISQTHRTTLTPRPYSKVKWIMWRLAVIGSHSILCNNGRFSKPITATIPLNIIEWNAHWFRKYSIWMCRCWNKTYMDVSIPFERTILKRNSTKAIRSPSML